MNDVITHNQIKHIKSLHQSKFRQKYNNFIAEGDKIAEEILQNSIYKIINLFATDEWLNNNIQLAEKHQNVLTRIDKAEMGKISVLKTATNVLLVLEKRSEAINVTLINEGHGLYLDDVQDPGNVGTIIRIADWFGIKSVIRSKGSADFYNPKVIQATMGSFLNVNLYTQDFADLSALEHQTIGAAMQGQSIDQFQWPKKSLLIMGNEGKGIKGSIQNKLDHFISIPGDDNRIADSLNVSIAAGILCARMKN